MRETKTLIMISEPSDCDYDKGIIIDSVVFKDEVSGNTFQYLGRSCTTNGCPIKRSKLLKWAWSNSCGDKILVTADFSDGFIKNPHIKEA